MIIYATLYIAIAAWMSHEAQQAWRHGDRHSALVLGLCILAVAGIAVLMMLAR